MVMDQGRRQVSGTEAGGHRSVRPTELLTEPGQGNGSVPRQCATKPSVFLSEYHWCICGRPLFTEGNCLACLCTCVCVCVQEAVGISHLGHLWSLLFPRWQVPGKERNKG